VAAERRADVEPGIVLERCAQGRRQRAALRESAQETVFSDAEDAELDLEVAPPDTSSPAPRVGMISCDLMNLMMGVMPNMVMIPGSDPCNAMPMMTPAKPKRLRLR